MLLEGNIKQFLYSFQIHVDPSFVQNNLPRFKLAPILPAAELRLIIEPLYLGTSPKLSPLAAGTLAPDTKDVVNAIITEKRVLLLL